MNHFPVTLDGHFNVHIDPVKNLEIPSFINTTGHFITIGSIQSKVFF